MSPRLGARNGVAISERLKIFDAVNVWIAYSGASRFVRRKNVAIFNPSESSQSTAVQDAGPKLVPADELYIKLKKLQMEYEFLDIQVRIKRHKIIVTLVQSGLVCSRSQRTAAHAQCRATFAIILSLACHFLVCV